MFARNAFHPNPRPRIMRVSGFTGWSRGDDPAFDSLGH